MVWGMIALAVALAGCGGEDGARVTTVNRKVPDARSQPGFDSYSGGRETAAPAGPATSSSFSDTRPYVPSDPSYSYSAELPQGDGWSTPIESFPTGGALLRTTVDGPGGLFVLIDRTPYEVPQLGGDFESSRTVSHPRFGTATEYVFSTSEIIPECSNAPCVDYLIEDGSGGGWGVLAGGTDVAEAQALAGEVARSITESDP